MPRKQDRRQPEIEQLQRFPAARRAPPQSQQLAPREVDQVALGEAEPVQRQRGEGWFEPEQPDPTPAIAAPAVGGEPQPATKFQAPQRRTPRAWLLIAPAVTLALGMVLGSAIESARSGREPISAPATGTPATQPRSPHTSVVVRPAASSACLETARRADELIDLLVTNRRSRAADLLVAYTVASRQCRKDASP
jgi:hypothetical protein